jgi:hypothetical protein
MKTSYERGQEAFQEYMDSGMSEEAENPFCEKSTAGQQWQKGYDDARNEYLR